MTNHDFSSLDKLRIADPDTFVWVKGRLALISPAPGNDAMEMMTDATIWGLSQEAGFGRAIAEGFLTLMARFADDRLHIYEKMVRKAAMTGPTLGRIVAIFLAPVLMTNDVFLKQFQSTLEIMQQKGTYTLTAPLEVMAALLAAGEGPSAYAYMELLAATFAQEMTYNQSNRLVYLIPKAVAGFSAKRRRSQIGQLRQIAQTDLKLVDPFLDGVAKGLDLLDESALADFVAQALERYTHAPESCAKFLSLSSKVGKDAYAALLRAVPLSHVRAQLNRYLQARIGDPVAVRPLSELAKSNRPVSWVCADGRSIYLPDEIDAHSTPAENISIYKALSRLEAGFFEFGTFNFDLEKMADIYPDATRWISSLSDAKDGELFGDGERFINAFAQGALAADLFNLFEQARVAVHLLQHYPGLMRQVTPLMWTELSDNGGMDADDLLAPVFCELVLAKKVETAMDTQMADIQNQLVQLFHNHIDLASPVEASACLVCLAYDLILQELGHRIYAYTPFRFPYDRQLHWDLVALAFRWYQETANRIKARLRDNGLDIYSIDLRNRLAEQQGQLTAGDLAELIMVRSMETPGMTATIDLSDVNTDAILRMAGADLMVPDKTDDDAVCYPEWSLHLQDYLYDHARVYEVDVPEDGGGVFYDHILSRHQGMVANIRRSFELLKPEGLALLRQWPEGDAFDYRALLDFAMDRRAGRIPSDRLFIKRLKQERDVAVMLLVDVSRSTANQVSHHHTTVLDVAKEALVLFCEALQVVGDDYAVAGFSGAGRHCVDFYIIKRFQDALSDRVRSRISALKPQRSTRMGAAIRHAGSLLAAASARIRLLIIVSDGFPNDIGYKSDYAIADTCRSIQEVRSLNFHVKAITVNIGSDPRLDEIYGRNHHHVIGDVHELPDKLVRLYGSLTRV